ncbi:MAG: hypothetical protein J6I76_15855 [Oribacterium sp.]|nr:hypothetical protein [Oribacterium sp.]
MIKLLALLTMLIDHIGVILLKDIIIFRLIGRFAMPLFAYCIARGFHFSKQHGTLKKYVSNILALTLISEIPYSLIVQYPAINIGFTWLSAITILFVSLIVKVVVSKTLKYFIDICSSCLSGFTMVRISCK